MTRHEYPTGGGPRQTGSKILVLFAKTCFDVYVRLPQGRQQRQQACRA
jgi:hypothetical protein